MTIVRSPRSRRRRRRVAGRAGPGAGPRGWSSGSGPGGPSWREPGAVAVQLLPSHLAAEELPPAAVGDEIEVCPAIYAGGHRPALDAADRWEVDEFGGLAARGAVLSPPAPEPPYAPVSPDVLDVAGLLYPINWAASGGPGGERIDLEGALYLDPELHPGTEFGDSVILCRRWYRVQAIRRYHRTAFGPRAPVVLAAVPEPAEVTDAAVYVADLLPLPDPALSAATW